MSILQKKKKIIKDTVDPDVHWIMHFDGAMRTNEFRETILGVLIIFCSPERVYIPHSFSLLEPCSNNAAKYTALIMGFELALESGIDILAIYGDSQLIIKQMNLEYEMRKPNLVPNFNKAQELKSQFTLIEFHHIPRHENVKADALAELIASMALPENDMVKIIATERKLLSPLDTHQVVADCFQVSKNRAPSYKISFGDRREHFIDCILYGILPNNVKDWTCIQRREPIYYYNLRSKTLY